MAQVSSCLVSKFHLAASLIKKKVYYNSLKFRLRITNLQICSKEITQNKTKRKGYRKYSFLFFCVCVGVPDWELNPRRGVESAEA